MPESDGTYRLLVEAKSGAQRGRSGLYLLTCDEGSDASPVGFQTFGGSSWDGCRTNPSNPSRFWATVLPTLDAGVPRRGLVFTVVMLMEAPIPTRETGSMTEGEAGTHEPPIPEAPFKHGINPLVKAILRSPLHRLPSCILLIVTFKGRRSGEACTTPAGDEQRDRSLYITAQTDRVWWRIPRGGAPVPVSPRGRRGEGSRRGHRRWGHRRSPNRWLTGWTTPPVHERRHRRPPIQATRIHRRVPRVSTTSAAPVSRSSAVAARREPRRRRLSPSRAPNRSS